MDNQSSSKREKMKENSEQLISKLVAAIDKEPTKAQNYYDLGSLLTKLNSHEQAEELFMKALGLFEKDVKATNLLKYGLGNLYYEQGSYDEAIKEYSQIENSKLKADAYLMVAQSLVQMHDYKRAIAYGITAHELRKQDPEINEVLGDAFLALGGFEQAKEYYDDILKYHPGRAETQFNRGLVAMVLGEKYQDYLEQARQLDPEYYTRSEQKIADIEKTLQNPK